MVEILVMTYFAWMLLCATPAMTGECTVIKLHETHSWRDCWSRVEVYRQALGEGPEQNYRVWCSSTEYLEQPK